MFEHQPTALWTAVENFLSDVVVRPDTSLKDAVAAALEAGMPPIEVAPQRRETAQAVGPAFRFPPRP